MNVAAADPAADLLRRVLAIADLVMYPPAKVSTPDAVLRALAEEVDAEQLHMRPVPRAIEDDCYLLVGALNALISARHDKDFENENSWLTVSTVLATIGRRRAIALGILTQEKNLRAVSA